MVLPSHRAGIHLRRYLAQEAGRAIWSPELYEPSGFLERIASARLMDSTEALLLLHQCHLELLMEHAEPLEEFLQWAPTTLRDMSEADAHLLDLDSLYRDLRQYHEIEAWSFHGSDELSAGQRSALERWRDTGRLHARFAEQSAASQRGSYGQIARGAASLASAPGWRPPWDAVWFAGLNALDPALDRIASALTERGIARFAWDADRFYLDNREHEAGRFLRRSIQAHGQGLIAPVEAIATAPRQIENIALADRAAMVRHAVSWALDLKPEERGSAVIVLADESLLLPLLEAMPSRIGPLNVTMGLSIGMLPAHDLEGRYLRLMHGAAAEGLLDRKDLVELLRHPMMNEGEPTQRMLTNLKADRISPQEIADAATEAGSACAEQLARALGPGTQHIDWPQRMHALHAWSSAAKRGDAFAQAQLLELAKAGRLLDAHLRKQAIEGLSAASYAVLRERTARQARLALSGEPLQGLQIMGVLETRALDHEQVLVLGAEEGVLSGGEGAQSWIPFDLRRHWGLPMRGDADAIASYHTHRWLHGAKEIGLLHSSGGRENGPARYIAQWRHTFTEGQPTRFVERTIIAPLAARATVEVAVPKTPEAIARIKAKLAKGISPSALAHWLGCPLDFHARHVLGMKDEDPETGVIAANTLGSAIHKILEDAMRPSIGSRLQEGPLLAAAAAVHDDLRARFVQEGFHPAALVTGANRLVLEMAAKALQEYLRAEARNSAEQEVVVQAVEQRASADLGPGLRLSGIMDRMDARDGLLHVLDIKTGKVDERSLSISLLEGARLQHGQHQALQLICYAILCFHARPDADRLRAGLIPLRRHGSSEAAWLRIDGEDVIHRHTLPAMEGLIHGLVQEMLDSAIPFRHEARAQYCIACAR